MSRNSVFLIALWFSLPVLSVTPGDFELEEVVVTADADADRKDACRLIGCVTRDEIAALPVRTIADILAFLPHLDLRSRGASHAQSDFSMRGGTFDQAVVLLNGVPLQDSQTGHYALNIPVSTALIERIEVLQGTDADMTGALTGAINIITSSYTPKDAYSLLTGAGINGEVTPAFTGRWKRGEIQISSSVEYARNDGYYAPTTDPKEKAALTNTDYQLTNIFFRTRWRGLDVQAGAQYKDAGLGTGYGYASTDQFDATRTMIASCRYEHSFRTWKIRTMVTYRGQYDRYEWHRGTPANRHWTHNTQATVHAQYHWQSVTGMNTQFGVEMKDEYIRSTNMGEHNRWQVSLRAKQHFQQANWLASFSIAGHYNSWCGWYGSGAAQVGYDFSGKGAVHLTVNRSLRMPTWTDLFYKAGVQRGSTDLMAEKAWTAAIGGHYTKNWKQAGRLRLSADVYYRWGTDIIDWSYDASDSLFHASNRHRVNTLGVELSIGYHLNTWLRTVSLHYAYTHLSLDLTASKSNYLDGLRHKLILNINHGIYVWSKGCVGADWSLRWQDRQGTYVDIHGTPENPFHPVLLVDGSIYMECGRVRVALQCTNMTNRHYYDYGGILAPGAQGRIQITANL